MWYEVVALVRLHEYAVKTGVVKELIHCGLFLWAPKNLFATSLRSIALRWTDFFGLTYL